MIALIAAAGVGLVLGIGLVRLFAGPTLYDRALVGVSTVIKAVLICAALAVAARQPSWLDVAFALAFAGLVLAVATLKFFRTRTFQAPIGRGARG